MASVKKPRFTYNRLNRRLDVLVRGKLWLQVILAFSAFVASMTAS